MNALPLIVFKLLTATILLGLFGCAAQMEIFDQMHNGQVHLYDSSPEDAYRGALKALNSTGFEINAEIPQKGQILASKFDNFRCGRIYVKINLIHYESEKTAVEVEEFCPDPLGNQMNWRQSAEFLAKLPLKRSNIQTLTTGRITPASPPESPSLPQSDVDRIPTTKMSPKNKSFAVVIGIEQYREKLPKADFADRDAKLVGEYLTKIMGYPEENVIVRTNDKASMNDLVKYLESWLPNNAEKDSSVFIYYSGHGAPNTKTGDAYLVPYDGDPTFVEKTGYPLKKLYAQLESLPTSDITVVLDSCFSGAGGRSVVGKGLRPMGLSIENSISAAGKAVVLAASSGDQVSSTYEEKGHGLLTYFFLKGLQGEGDLNKDGNIDMAELYEYVKPSVSRIARKQYNNEQTPQLLGSPDSLKRGSRLIERASP